MSAAEFSWPDWLPRNAEPASEAVSEIVPEEFAAADAAREQQLNDRYLAARRQILNEGEGAYYRQRGEAAIHAAPTALEVLQRLKDDTLAEAGNERQRRALARRLDGHHGEAMRGLSRHLVEQGEAWKAAVAGSQVKTAEAEAAANHGDPAMVALHADGAYTVALRLAGEPPESEAAQARASAARSSVWRRALEAALAAGDNRSAIGLYDRAKDELAPGDAGPMHGQIKAVMQRETAQSWLAGLDAPQSDTPSAFFDAPKLLADADAARQAATAKNESDWADDPEQRSINQHYIDVQFGERKQDITQARADLDVALRHWIETPRPDGRPQTDLPPPPLWAHLSADERQSVLDALRRNAGVIQAQASREEPAMSDLSPEIAPDGQQLAQAEMTADDPATQPATANEGRRGIAPDTEPPPGSLGNEGRRGAAPATEPLPDSSEYRAAMTKAVGHPVVLPDGSHVPDSRSDTGHLMSPAPDLRSVAEAGRKAGEQYRALIDNPETADSASVYLGITAGLYVGQGGIFDYQREGNHLTGFEQRPHFRAVSNFNVGLFCQQAGLTLEEALTVAGHFASIFSSNYDPSQPHGLPSRTAEFITRGFKAGESGIFDRTTPP